MRVCQLIESTSGGSVRVALDLTRGLLQVGDDVTFIYSPLRADEAFYAQKKGTDGALFLSLPMERSVGWRDLLSFFKLCRLLQKHGPFDVLHAHSSKAGALARLAGVFFSHTKIVYTPHAFVTMAPDASRLYGVIERGLSPLADAIIVVSEAEKDHALHAIGIAPHRIRVVPNGITFDKSITRGAARQAMGVDDSVFVVGFVGRLVEQKNPVRLIEAFSLVSQTHPSLRLVLVGNGPLLPLVEKKIAAMGCKDKVLFFKNHEAQPLMPAFDALLSSSDYEGLSLVFLEALQAGVPIVTTPVGGVQEAVLSGKTGFVADDFTVESLARALTQIVDVSQEERQQMSLASRQHGEAFTVEAMTRAVRQVYKDVLDGKTAS
ncbi:MAG: glycosyltransferase family 4 protein [Bdellovibrionales bacterium]|jgi:glycosyltransferase involved in cell wall biosynthesis